MSAKTAWCNRDVSLVNIVVVDGGGKKTAVEFSNEVENRLMAESSVV